MKQFVYADNAATTQISKEVLDAMMPWLTEGYGNPSSIYELGRTAGFAIEDARKQVAAALGAQPAEIYFTGCGSESDNWAIKGAAHKLAAKGKKHLITTVFEHHAVLHTCAALEKEGFEVTYLPVDHNGLITAQQVADAIRPDTALVSIMYANNEIGTIMPIPEIGALCRERGVWFHTDAVQAVGNIEIDVAAQNIDMLSLSGHKIHAPKGIGALYIKKGIVLPNLIDGGEQERGRRAGTENVASIIGLGRAMEIACADIPAKISKVTPLRNKMIDELLTLPMSRLNGDRERRLAGNANLSFVGAEGRKRCCSGLIWPASARRRVRRARPARSTQATSFWRLASPMRWRTGPCASQSAIGPRRRRLIISSIRSKLSSPARGISPPLWEDIQKGAKRCL